MTLYINVFPSGAKGTFEPMVMLHGWGFDSRTMAPLARALQPWADVWLVDLPGFGRSAAPLRWSCEQLLQQLADALPKRCQLLGWSLGGNLATLFSQRYPERVSRLITLGSNACFVVKPGWPTAMAAEVNRQFNADFGARPAATAKRFVALVATGSPQPQERLKQLRQLHSDGELDRQRLLSWRAALDYLAVNDNRAPLQQLHCPVLHVLAEQDALVPVNTASALTALNANHQVITIAKAGHAMHLDQPDTVAQAISQFCAGKSNTADTAVNMCHQQLDKRHIARSFSRAATTYESVARLQRAVGEQLLATVVAPASRVLDLGSGTGMFSSGLRRATGADYHCALDLAEGMLRYGRSHNPEPDAWLCADAESLPLADSSMDLVFSSLAIQWCENLAALFSELYRVLAPAGRLHIATLGPGTLNELHSAWQQVDQYTHVNRFVPSQSLFAAACAAGFVPSSQQVVVETLYSPSLIALSRELKGLGAHNVNRGRRLGLTGRTRLQLLQNAYEQHRQPRGLPASYEVVYLTADKPASCV